MGRLFIIDVDDEENGYRCKHCLTFVARSRDCRVKIQVDATQNIFIFSKLVNVTFEEPEEVANESGVWFQTGRDPSNRGLKYNIYCVQCGSYLGAKYAFMDGGVNTHVIDRDALVGADGTNSPAEWFVD